VHFQESLALERQLAQRDPRNTRARGGMSICLNELGKLAVQRGDLVAARNYHREDLRVLCESAGLVPDLSRVRGSLVMALTRLGNLDLDAEEFENAGLWFERSLRMQQSGRPNPQARQDPMIANTMGLIAQCKTVVRVLDDLDFAVKQPAEYVPWYLSVRARVLARRGQHADVAATADRIATLKPADPAFLYEAGCGYALAARAVAPATSPERLTPEQKAALQAYATRAVDWLGKAVKAGFRDRDAWRTNTALDVLRQRADFQALDRELEAQTAPKKAGAPKPPS
jgi:tetratricopeptide (TPR) repeat protein